ncbi:MAG: hypothetical protein Q8J97_05180, partial [Flavobacteriaceae bacterium]|nr:hypothetical protein [Flavobacteriaceae bacterium]
MPLTKYALELIGFTEIPLGIKIEATFFSAVLFSIDGINIKNGTSESYPDLSYFRNDFSFAFGNSINDISKKILNDDFVDDELSWQKEKKTRPPYFLVHFGINDPFTCSTGYWKKNEDKLIT